MSDIVGMDYGMGLPSTQWAPGLIEPGNITDLKTRPAVDFTDHEGKPATGTIYSITFQEDPYDPSSPWVLAPSIYDGEWHSGAEAEVRYRDTGRHLGKFRTLKENEEYAEALSKAQGRRDGPPMR
jgi:hypothetical protein